MEAVQKYMRRILAYVEGVQICIRIRPFSNRESLFGRNRLNSDANTSRIPLDSAVESQQFRSHRRSTFFEIYGYVAPYTRRPLACRARRNEGIFPQ